SGARTDINDAGIRGRHRDSADRPGGFFVEERNPGRTEVRGAPDTAVIETDIEHVGLAWHTGKCSRSAGPRRTDRAPLHVGIKPLIDGSSCRQRGENAGEVDDSVHETSWDSRVIRLTRKTTGTVVKRVGWS